MIYGKKIIALCISNAGDTGHFQFIQALNRVLQDNGYKLFVYHTCTDFYHQKKCEEGEKAIFELIDYDIVDGVVIFSESFMDPVLTDQIIASASGHKIPVISVGEVHPNATTLMFDYESGFESIVRHVIEEHGITDTCMIAGAKGEYHSENRIKVYKKVLSENNLSFSDERPFYGDFWWGPTREAVQQMIADGTLPRAIICANDSMAIAACEELKKSGYSVPEQVVVTGFDGIMEAMYNKPPLTTAKCDMTLSAKAILNILQQAEEHKPLQQVYGVPYVKDIYRSCGCRRRANHNINIGERMKWAEDRFNKYQDDERTLMEVSEMILGCDSPKQFAECLQEFNFYNICVVMNEECLDESVNPALEERLDSFDDRMQVIYRTEADNALFPEAMPKKYILPDLEEWVRVREEPLLFTPLTFLGKAFGYLHFGSFHPEEYAKILQYVKTLSNAFGTYRIIRNLKYTAASIEKMSQTDYLTGVLNRTGFFDALPDLLAVAERKYVIVASVDVDNLKQINDRYGHAAGDFVIKAVAQAIGGIPFGDKLCGRFGGDEMVVCAVADTVAEERLLKDGIDKNLAIVNKESGNPYLAEASIGTVTVRADGLDFLDALKKADKLMYENKARKKAGRR